MKKKNNSITITETHGNVSVQQDTTSGSKHLPWYLTVIQKIIGFFTRDSH